RLFCIPQALPQRRLLFGPHLPGDGVPGGDVPGAFRDPAHRWLDRAMGRDAARLRAENRAAEADLRRLAAARLHSTRQTIVIRRLTPRSRRTQGNHYLSAISACSALIVVTLAASMLFAQAAPPKFDSNRAWEHLRQMVAIGPRPSGSAAIEQTRKYIVGQLQTARVAVSEQAWDDETPGGKTHMVNLIATIPGARPDRIIFSGHYDTKLFRKFRFVGADDGGSSAAFLIELARVLKARINPFTIEIVFLDGEEAVCENWDDCSKPGAPDNTYGSRHYVAAARQSRTLAGIKANILVDMIADRNLRLKREGHSTPWLTD